MQRFGLLASAFALVGLIAATGCGGTSVAPSPAPTSEYAFPAPTVTMDVSKPTVKLTYASITVSSTFSDDSNSTKGTMDVNLGFNNGDITPAILPADNATVGNTALVYLSFYTTTKVRLGNPTITVTDASGFDGGTTCELDGYIHGGGPIAAGWVSTGFTGTVSGDSVTIAPASVGYYLFLGQAILAISCN